MAWNFPTNLVLKSLTLQATSQATDKTHAECDTGLEALPACLQSLAVQSLWEYGEEDVLYGSTRTRGRLEQTSQQQQPGEWNMPFGRSLRNLSFLNSSFVNLVYFEGGIASILEPVYYTGALLPMRRSNPLETCSVPIILLEWITTCVKGVNTWSLRYWGRRRIGEQESVPIVPPPLLPHLTDWRSLFRGIDIEHPSAYLNSVFVAPSSPNMTLK